MSKLEDYPGTDLTKKMAFKGILLEMCCADMLVRKAHRYMKKF